jgi:hypothetical protein
MEPSQAVSISQAPSTPGIIAHIEAPGPGTGIIEPVKPGIIIESCSVYYRRPIDKGVQVAGSIALIYILGRDIVYINVFDIVQRRIRRDPVHFSGSFGSHRPGAGRAGALEPDAIIHRIIDPVIEHHRGRGVRGILHIRSLEGSEFRIAVIVHIGGSRTAVDLGRLGDLCVHHCFPGCRGAGDTGQDIILGRAFGNPGEISGESVGSKKVPASAQRRRAVPATGDQHIIFA